MRTLRHSLQRVVKRSPIHVFGDLSLRPAAAIVRSIPSVGAAASSDWRVSRVAAPGTSWVSRVVAPGHSTCVCFGTAAVAVVGCTVAACESRSPVRRIDLTGDGVAETTAYDTVGDGKVGIACDPLALI